MSLSGRNLNWLLLGKLKFECIDLSRKAYDLTLLLTLECFILEQTFLYLQFLLVNLRLKKASLECKSRSS